MRCQLQPLDSEVLKQLKPSVENQFIAALLDFSEWDDYNRDTYLWPESISKLLMDKVLLQRFFDKAEHHILRLSGRPLTDVFLFLLLAERLGYIEYFDDYVDEYVLNGQCTMEVSQLFEYIKSIKEDLTSTTRRSCRVGDDYQAAVEESSELSQTIIDSRRLLVTPVDVSLPDECFSRDAVDSFLGSVQLLRERYVSVDQLIEAPHDIDLFRSRLTSYQASIESPHADNYSSPLMRYRRLKTLEGFIASSRRTGYALTSLSTVKRVVQSPADRELQFDSQVDLSNNSEVAAEPSHSPRDDSRAAHDFTAVGTAGHYSCSFNGAPDESVPPTNLLEQEHVGGGSSESCTYEYHRAHNGGGSSGVEEANDCVDLYEVADYIETREVDVVRHEHDEVDLDGTAEHEELDMGCDKIDQIKGNAQFDQPTRSSQIPNHVREVIEILDDDEDDDDDSTTSLVVIDLTESRSVSDGSECALKVGAINAPIHTELLGMDGHAVPMHEQLSGDVTAGDLQQRSGAWRNDGIGAEEESTRAVSINYLSKHYERSHQIAAASASHHSSAAPASAFHHSSAASASASPHSSATSASTHSSASHRSSAVPISASHHISSAIAFEPIDAADHSSAHSPGLHNFSSGSSRGMEDEKPPSRDDLDNAPTQSPINISRGVESVVVYKGVHELEVPIELCRILSVPDDLALDVLKSCNGQADIALRILEEKLRGAAHYEGGSKTKKALMRERRELHLTMIRPAELDILHRVVNK